jgi:hypothetical protein
MDSHPSSVHAGAKWASDGSSRCDRNGPATRTSTRSKSSSYSVLDLAAAGRPVEDKTDTVPLDVSLTHVRLDMG